MQPKSRDVFLKISWITAAPVSYIRSDENYFSKYITHTIKLKFKVKIFNKLWFQNFLECHNTIINYIIQYNLYFTISKYNKSWQLCSNCTSKILTTRYHAYVATQLHSSSNDKLRLIKYRCASIYILLYVGAIKWTAFRSSPVFRKAGFPCILLKEVHTLAMLPLIRF